MVRTRRAFLRTAAAVGGLVGLAPLVEACTPVAPSPTAAPARPTDVPKPAAEPTRPAGAPAAQPAASPAAVQPAAQPAASPAAAAPAAGKPRSDRTFKFAYLTLGWAGTEIIHQQNLLQQRGWNIEWQTVGPINGLVNAFASGQADIIDMSVVIAAGMYESGVKLKVFGGGVGTLGAVLVPRDSTIKSVPELKGKKVGGVPGGTTTQDINASIRKIHTFDVFKDTQFIQAQAPPDAANLLVKGDVEALLIWEPTTSQLVIDDKFRVLATQQELWEQASGSKQTQVHVIYLTTPEIAEQFRPLLVDINAAQREAADLWKKKDPKAIDAIMAVTQMPKPVVELALGKTTPLAGIDDAMIDTMLTQLKFNREFGTLLKSDVWNDPGSVKNELFVKA